MTTAPRAIGLGELALRAANRRGAWIVLLISDAESVTTAAEELIAELEVMSEEPPVHVRDLKVPAPLMSPGEVLEILRRDLRIERKPRRVV